MAKRDKKGNGGMSNGKRIALIVLVVILIAALLGGGIYAAWHFTDGFKTFPWQTQQPEEDAGNDSGTNPGVITGNYYVESDGMKYGDGGVMRLASGSAFTVGAGFGGGYSVKFTARKIASDFSFTLGAEPYQWNNVAGDDFTEGFTITKTGTGFTVEFGTLAEIVSAVKGNAVTIPEGQRVSVPDKFTMAVTAANGRGISLNFTLSALGVELDPDGIIFGNETAEPDAGEEPEPEETPLSEEAKAFISYVEKGLSIIGDFQSVITFFNAADEKYAALDADDQAQERVVKAKAALDILKSSYRQGMTAEEWRAVQEEARAVFEG